MALTNFQSGAGFTQQTPAITPEDFGKLVDLSVQAKSVAARTSTVFSTNKDSVTFPTVVSQPDVAWYNELDTIADTDMDTGEVSVSIYKTAGLTLISNELAADSSPAVADLVGGALSNKIARAIDAAFLGDTTAKGPSGLLSTSYTSVDDNGALTNLDSFVKAVYASKNAGSEGSTFVMLPAVAEAISLLKTDTGSNRSLVELVDDGIRIAGVPVLVSDQVDSNTVAWLVPRAHTILVARQGTEVQRFENVERDGMWIRATSRYGFGYLNQPGIVRIWDQP